MKIGDRVRKVNNYNHPSLLPNDGEIVGFSPNGTINVRWDSTLYEIPGYLASELMILHNAPQHSASETPTSGCQHKWVDYQPFRGEAYKCCANEGCGVRYDEVFGTKSNQTTEEELITAMNYLTKGIP